MVKPSLTRLAGRVPQRWRRRVPLAIRNAAVARFGHPEPRDGGGPTGPGVPYPRDREGVDNLHLEMLLGWWLREASNCVDVGANEGRFLWHITQRAPRGRHVAFEPIPALAAILRERFPSVDVREAAVADRAGDAEYVVVEESGYSGLRERDYPQDFATERIRVRTVRLDDALEPQYVPDLIKVDVEGGELAVLLGAMETIARHRPVVAFEHGLGAANHYGTKPEQVWDLLAGEAGLRIFDLDARGPLSRDGFAEVFARGERWNFVALP